MRFNARLVLGVFGLALMAPGWAVAAPPGDEAPAAATASVPPTPHQHKGLFGWRHCVICQRARAKAQYGIDVPPPPSLGPVAGVQGQVSIPAGHITHAPGASCPTCQGEVVMTGPSTIVEHSAPGYAVVGDPGGMPAANAPGYAVVGGSSALGPDPAPIGVARNQQVPGGFDARMAANGRRPGSSPYDPAVVPSNLPPSQVALSNSQHNSRASIIAHVIGFPKLGLHRREQEEKERAKHAAIAYDESKSPVSEIPASVVYGKGGH